MKNCLHILLAVLLTFTVQSCSIIDDDLTKCPEKNQTFQLNYEMRLVTNMDIELDLVLNAVTDTLVRRLVHQNLSSIFSDHAHDVDLSFFRTTDGERSYYRNDIIDDNRSSFTFYLPKESYRHLALANIDDAETIRKTNDLSQDLLSIRNIEGDTLPSQTTGLFSARLDMDVQDSIDQEFDVHLFMVNSAMALVIDTTDVSVDNIEVYTIGTGCGFSVNDSVFDFSRKPVVHANELKVDRFDMPEKSGQNRIEPAMRQKFAAFTSVNFPSDNLLTTDGYWQVHVYTKLKSGSVTQTKLSIPTPLHAGELKVIRAKLGTEGQVTPVTASEAGVSVTLDWKPADEYNQDW